MRHYTTKKMSSNDGVLYTIGLWFLFWACIILLFIGIGISLSVGEKPIPCYIEGYDVTYKNSHTGAHKTFGCWFAHALEFNVSYVNPETNTAGFGWAWYGCDEKMTELNQQGKLLVGEEAQCWFRDEGHMEVQNGVVPYWAYMWFWLAFAAFLIGCLMPCYCLVRLYVN